MGIQGLLPLLKSIQRPTELKKYAGETFGVDAYGWLHRGAVACAVELAQGKPTRKYVDFAMHRVRMLKHFGVTPYLIFDGDLLPSKAATETSREKRRADSRKAGLELLKAGKPSQAHLELQKAVDITPEMARNLIECLKQADVPYVVAPYEADPQMVYLERKGIISGILSEDSDLLVFGARRLLTKLDQYGNCVEINRRDFCACREVSLTGWSDKEFRHMTIMSGCDYLASIGNLGLKTAYRMIRKHKTPEKAVRMMQFDGKFRIPPDYLTLFRNAELTFLHPWVFCPEANKLVHLNDLENGMTLADLPFIGPYVEPELAREVAVGNVNPMTKEPIVVPSLPSPRKRTASGTTRNPPPSLGATQPRKPIKSYFKSDTRIPMGEMEPNCFSMDRNRVASLTENGTRPIVYPLPRPYVEPPSQSRTYVSRESTLRRRTAPVGELLSNGGQTLESSFRRQSAGPAASSSAAEPSLPASRPPKKVRLCDDEDASEDKEEQSRFFPKQDAKHAPRRGGEGYLMSDDSIEAALQELPDADGWRPYGQGRKEIGVFQDSQASSASSSREDAESSVANSFDSITDANPRPPLSQSALGRFAYAPSQSRNARRNRDSVSSIQSFMTESTPAQSVRSSASRPSTAQTTPATPQMTPLQRLGAKALNRRQQPPTPSFAAPRPPKRVSSGRKSLDSIPVNPSFVPLPPVDLDEIEALHQNGGSEDMIIPESESEDAPEPASGKAPGLASTKLDLSKFLFH